MEKRPSITDDEIVLAVCKPVAKKHNLGALSYLTDHFLVDAHNGQQMEEAFRRDYGWRRPEELTDEFLDDVDSMFFNADKMLHQKEKEWFERNQPEQPFPIGTKIKEGVIDGIDEYGYGRYLVKKYGSVDTKNSRERRIVNFEDAVSI